MKTKIIMMLVSTLGIVGIAQGAIVNHTQNQIAQYNTLTAEEQREIAILENDIRLIDDEIAKCQKKKKGWIAATVIGSAGVLSTGVAAIVQGVKIGERKDELADKKQELNEIKDQTKALTIQ